MSRKEFLHRDFLFFDTNLEEECSYEYRFLDHRKRGCRIIDFESTMRQPLKSTYKLYFDYRNDSTDIQPWCPLYDVYAHVYEASYASMVRTVPAGTVPNELLATVAPRRRSM